MRSPTIVTRRDGSCGGARFGERRYRGAALAAGGWGGVMERLFSASSPEKKERGGGG